MKQTIPTNDAMRRLVDSDPVDAQQLERAIGGLVNDAIAEARGPGGSRDLVEASRTRRRSWAVIAAAACVVTMAITLGLAILSPNSSPPAYAITVDGGVIVVDWMRDLRSGSAIAEDLRTHGVDAAVRTVPASPSRVGRILTAIVDGDPVDSMPPGVSWGADGSDEVFTWRIDPAVFTGSIDIEIGVETEPGEPYEAADSAFAPGEVLGGLHCALHEAGDAVSPEAIERQLHRLDLDANWFLVTEAEHSTAGDIADNTPMAAPPEGIVLDVSPIDDHTVEVSVAPPGSSPTLPIFRPVRPSTPCTPELADRWIGVI